MALLKTIKGPCRTLFLQTVSLVRFLRVQYQNGQKRVLWPKFFWGRPISSPQMKNSESPSWQVLSFLPTCQCLASLCSVYNQSGIIVELVFNFYLFNLVPASSLKSKIWTQAELLNTFWPTPPKQSFERVLGLSNLQSKMFET